MNTENLQETREQMSRRNEQGWPTHKAKKHDRRREATLTTSAPGDPIASPNRVDWEEVAFGLYQVGKIGRLALDRPPKTQPFNQYPSENTEQKVSTK